MRARAAALALLGAVVAGPAVAQELEVVPRAPGVRVPWGRIATAERGPFFPSQARVRFSARDIMAEPASPLVAETTFPMLIIPALFSDSEPSTVAPSEMAAVAFGTEGRTLTTFYQEMSGGRLTITGGVTEWVRTRFTTLEAAGQVDGHGLWTDSTRSHFKAAVDLVDPQVDFRQYDSDGPDGVPDSGDDDGLVDAIAFKFAEVPGSCGGPGIWPHRWLLTDAAGNVGYPTDDVGADGRPIRVAGYTTESVIECDGETPQGPNVMAHEFGHILGLPDFYRAVDGLESEYRHWHMGCFALMAAGSWGCGQSLRVIGYGPSGLSAISRRILGWTEEQFISTARDLEVELQPIQSGGGYLLLPLDDNESLAVAYRPRIGFDDQLPAGGVLIYHADYTADLFGGSNARDHPIHLVEADGRRDLRTTIENGGNRGEAGDVFARGSVVDSLTPFSEPAATFKDGRLANVWLRDIRVEGGVARLRISVGSPLTARQVLLPPVARALQTMEIRFEMRGGTPPYESLAPPGGYPIDGLSTRMEDGQVVVEGVPLVAGESHTIPIHVRDAEGNGWVASPRIEFVDAELEDAELLDALLDPGPANLELRTYLDNAGTADGAFDLGDVRAYLVRTRS